MTDATDPAAADAPMTDADVLGAFEDSGAILSGHFVLTSGRHSARYVQCARVLEDPALTTRFAREMVRRLGARAAAIDLVAAPAVGGIIIGFAVAQALGTRFIFSEREQGAMTLRRGFQVPEGARVLVVEDVVTTGGSVAELIELVRTAGGEVVDVVSLIDRGGQKAFDARYQPLLRLEVDSWHADDCALCAAEEPVTSPGSRRLGV
jgi:orotate phosphoribosyltransferase